MYSALSEGPTTVSGPPVRAMQRTGTRLEMERKFDLKDVQVKALSRFTASVKHVKNRYMQSSSMHNVVIGSFQRNGTRSAMPTFQKAGTKPSRHTLPRGNKAQQKNVRFWAQGFGAKYFDENGNRSPGASQKRSIRQPLPRCDEGYTALNDSHVTHGFHSARLHRQWLPPCDVSTTCGDSTSHFLANRCHNHGHLATSFVKMTTTRRMKDSASPVLVHSMPLPTIDALQPRPEIELL